MARSIYVVMKKRRSPIYITEARPHAVVPDKRGASAMALQLNQRALENEYWVERVNFVDVLTNIDI